MSFTPKDAAEAVGMTRQGILKAIRTGRISATKAQDGTWRIEPVELFRVYPPKRELQATVAPEVVASTQGREAELQAQIEGLKALLDAMRDERDDLRQQRDKWQHQATALISDRRPWWKRLVG